MTDGRGPRGAASATEVLIDLNDTIRDPKIGLTVGQQYHWGVLLVELNPYKRLRHLGGDRLFLLEQNQTGARVDGP